MDIERDFEIVVEEYNAVNERLSAIQHDMATSQLIVRRIQERMGTKQAAAVALAVELYKAGPAASDVEAILSSESLAEIYTRVQYLRSSNHAHAAVFERLAADRVELDAHLATLERKKADALAAQAQLDRLRVDVEDKIAAQRDEIRDLNAALRGPGAAIKRPRRPKPRPPLLPRPALLPPHHPGHPLRRPRP